MDRVTYWKKTVGLEETPEAELLDAPEISNGGKFVMVFDSIDPRASVPPASEIGWMRIGILRGTPPEYSYQDGALGFGSISLNIAERDLPASACCQMIYQLSQEPMSAKSNTIFWPGDSPKGSQRGFMRGNYFVMLDSEGEQLFRQPDGSLSTNIPEDGDWNEYDDGIFVPSSEYDPDLEETEQSGSGEVES